MDSHSLLKNYCDSNGIDPSPLEQGELDLFFEGGLAAHLDVKTRAVVGFRIDVGDMSEGADRNDVLKSCLKANTALIAERTGVLTIDPAKGKIVLAGAIDAQDANVEGFSDVLEERLDEAERLSELISAIS